MGESRRGMIGVEAVVRELLGIILE